MLPHRKSLRGASATEIRNDWPANGKRRRRGGEMSYFDVVGYPSPEQRIAELERELAEARKANGQLRSALLPLALCCLPPEGFYQRGVTAHFTTMQIIAARDALDAAKEES